MGAFSDNINPCGCDSQFPLDTRPGIQLPKQLAIDVEQLKQQVQALSAELSSVASDIDVHEANTDNAHALNTIRGSLESALHTLNFDIPITYARQENFEQVSEIVDTLQNPKGIDFTHWYQTPAYPIYDQASETVFLLAKLSTTFADERGYPTADNNTNKPCTVYLKYVNGHLFDSVITAGCSGTKGNIQVVFTREVATHPISFGLYKVTYETASVNAGQYDIYIGIKDQHLVGAPQLDDSLPPAYVMLAPINAVPIDGSEGPFGSTVEEICSVTCNTGIYSATMTSGAQLLKEIAIDGTRLTVQTSAGPKTVAFTDDTSVPVGAIVRWSNNAVTIPENYKWCNGDTLAAGDYPSLAVVFGIDYISSPAEPITLPIEDSSIIKVK